MEIIQNQLSKNESFGIVQMGVKKHPLFESKLKEKSNIHVNKLIDINSDQKSQLSLENQSKLQNNVKHHVRFSDENSAESP